MLSGDNSILNKAAQTKEETEVGEEKEIIKLATMHAIINNQNKSLKKEDLENELENKNVAIEKSGLNFKIKFNSCNHLYRLTPQGDVISFEEIEPTKIYAKLESDGTLKLRSSILEGYTEGTKWNSSDILKIIIEEPIAPKTASEMFENCTNLTSIENIKNLHTENATSMYYMFYNCNKLEKLDLRNFDTSKVTTMRSMFAQCHNIKELDLSNFNTQNVNSMINMFYGCNSLTSIDLSGFDTNKVTNISWLFRECSNLTSINFGNMDTSNVIYFEYIFGGCYKLKSLDLSSFNTQKAKSLNMMFNGCSGLEILDLSHFNISNVTEMNAMFRSCKSLSNNSLNSILKMCKTGTQVTNKTLKYLELNSNKASICESLSNYNAFIDSGWTTGY